MIIFLFFLSIFFIASLIYPLCLFAVHFKTAYSLIIISLLILAALAILVNHVRKNGPGAAIGHLAGPLIIAAGLVSFFGLVISGKRPAAFLTLLLAAALVVLPARLLKNSRQKASSEKQ